jgi:predicted methyltransferase MtxX (methanogen marker protein 4)
VELQIELWGDFLLATTSGTVVFSDALALWKKVVRAAAEQGADKILVNCCSVEGRLSAADRFWLAVEVTEYLRQLRIHPKVAVVGRQPTVDEFCVRISQNRVVIAQAFAEPEDALEWLYR